MRSKGFIILSIILMVIILQLIILIIGAFFLNWFGTPVNNYTKYEKKITNDKKFINNDNTSDNKISINSKNNVSSSTSSTTTTITSNNYNVANLKDNSKKDSKFSKSTNNNIKNINNDLNSEKNVKYTKEGYVESIVEKTDMSFHSYGEYVSPEEYKYRISLVNNLKIKTVVIDALTKGNGVSQEFFRVVYQNSMIPAKILEDIVESREFRLLIPKKYLKEETKIKGLPKGEKIVFKNQDIKNLLVLWTMGKLTPYQKAWKTMADR